MNKLSPTDAEKYLESFKVGENKYIIGIFESGITIYKQQLRALNIFNSLHVTRKITKGTRIGIIGGGIAGLTFAAAALKARAVVHIFEKKDTFIPIQSGCYTRQIHPHIYDWPGDDASVPYADLPVLTWTAGQTKEFCESIIAQYKEIVDSFERIGESKSRYLTEHLEHNITDIIYRASEKEYAIQSHKIVPSESDPNDSSVNLMPKGQSQSFCDIIIYAIGYGLERSNHDEEKTYWKDLPLHQSNSTNKYFISGTGDGALMDLIVLKLKDSSYDFLLKAIEENDHSNRLRTELEKIRRDFFSKKNSSSYIYNRYMKISEDHYKHFFDSIQIRQNQVVLNGQIPIEEIFNLDKVSLLNGFIVFLLLKKGAFTYKMGDVVFERSPLKCYVVGHLERYDDFFRLFRHGTDRDEVVNLVPHLAKEMEIADLKVKQAKLSKEGLVEKLFENVDLERIFRAAQMDENTSTNSLPLLEGYTNILAKSLSNLNGEAEFRIAVYKVFNKIVVADHMVYYQQITPYAGNEPIEGSAGYGRKFPGFLQDKAMGNVGFTIQTCKPTLVINRDIGNDFSNLMDLMNVQKKKELLVSEYKSFFTLPLLGPGKRMDTKKGALKDTKVVNLVISIESKEADFFKDPRIFDAVLTVTAGFVSALKSSVDKGQITMDKGNSFTVSWVEDKAKIKTIRDNKCFSQDDSFLELLRKIDTTKVTEELSFDRFYTFRSTGNN